MSVEKYHTPILVTGIERSGSSIIGQIIGLCGAFAGKVTPMQENIGIKKVMDRFYSKIGADIKGQYPLPDLGKLSIPVNWEKSVKDCLLAEGYIDTNLWMYKSNRIAQIWPVWAHAYPDAKWIIVRRRTGDVVESCLKTGFMTAYEDSIVKQLIGVETDREGWLWWVHEHEKMFVSMIESGLNCKVIWPERTLTGDFRQIYEMLDWLGLPWNKGVLDILESKLIKNQKV